MRKVTYIDVGNMSYKEACYMLGPNGVELYKTHVLVNIAFYFWVICSIVNLIALTVYTK